MTQSPITAIPAGSTFSDDALSTNLPDADRATVGPRTELPQHMTKRQSDHCPPDAIRVAHRICAAYPDHHRIVLLSGLTNKDQVGPTAYQTALALAMMEHGRVLIVDAMPKRPFLNDFIQLPAGHSGRSKLGPPGLAQVLSGHIAVEDSVLTGAVGNLDFLLAGATIEPAMFLSERCGLVLKHLRQQYAYVIMASAPVAASPESMRLAAHCDAVAAVVTPGKHSKRELRHLTNDLSALSIPMLGVILAR